MAVQAGAQAGEELCAMVKIIDSLASLSISGVNFHSSMTSQISYQVIHIVNGDEKNIGFVFIRLLVLSRYLG